MRRFVLVVALLVLGYSETSDGVSLKHAIPNLVAAVACGLLIGFRQIIGLPLSLLGMFVVLGGLVAVRRRMRR